MVKTPKPTCPKCSSAVKNSDQALQCEGKCENWFHIQCENVSRRDYQILVDDEDSAWICSGCSNHSPSRRDQFLKDHKQGIDKETVQGKSGKKAAKKAAQADKLKIEDLNPSVQKLGSKINQLVDSIEYMSSKYDEFFEQMALVRAENVRLTNEMRSIKKSQMRVLKENEDLKNKVHAIEQSLITNEVEITGIPCAENENCENIFRTICDKINYPVKDDEVIQARRVVPPPVNRKTTIKPSQQTIVVTLKNSAIRQKILDARKASLTVTVKDVGFAARDDAKFYINQRLTPYYRHLFWLARQTRNIGYKFCWVKHGNIYLRKTEMSPTIKVSSEADIPTDPRAPEKKKIGNKDSDSGSASEDEELFNDAKGHSS